MLLVPISKNLTQWLRNIQFLCEVSEWMQLAVPVMIFLTWAKKEKSKVSRISASLRSVDFSEPSWLTYMQAHTHRRTHCRCCCWFSSVCVCLPWFRHRSPTPVCKWGLEIELASFSIPVIDGLFVGKEGAWNECQVRKRLDSVCYRCQLFRLFAINKYES